MLGSGKCTVLMRCKIVLVSVLLQVTFSFDISNDENHPALVHLAQIERPGYWTFVEDNSQPIPFPRLGRKLFKLPNTLIPYPRTGRMLLDSDIFDYEESLVPADYSWHNIGDGDFFFDGKSSVKRASIAFPPRVGRKKRSISDEDQLEHEDQERIQSADSVLKPIYPNWYGIKEIDADYIFGAHRRLNNQRRQAFVPQVGMKRSENGIQDTVGNERSLYFQNQTKSALINSEIEGGKLQSKRQVSFFPRVNSLTASSQIFTPGLGKQEVSSPRKGKGRRLSTGFSMGNTDANKNLKQARGKRWIGHLMTGLLTSSTANINFKEAKGKRGIGSLPTSFSMEDTANKDLKQARGKRWIGHLITGYLMGSSSNKNFKEKKDKRRIGSFPMGFSMGYTANKHQNQASGKYSLDLPKNIQIVAN